MCAAYLYLLGNQQWSKYRKFGYTSDPINRFATYKTSGLYPYEVLCLWKIIQYPPEYDGIEHDKLLYSYLQECETPDIKHVYFGGGTEFYEVNDIVLIDNIYNLLGYTLQITEYSKLVRNRNKDVKELVRTRINSIQSVPLMEISLREHQQHAVNSVGIDKHFHGIYQVCVGGGKTVTGIAIHSKLKMNTLWLCYRNDIVDSQKNDFNLLPKETVMYCNHAGFKDEQVVEFLKPGGKMIVVLYQSLLKMDNNDMLRYEKLIPYIGCVIVDEAHALTGTNVTTLIRKLKEYVQVLIGMTATPFTDDPEQNKIMVNLYGDGTNLNHLTKPYDMFQAYADGYLVLPNVAFRMVGFDNLSMLASKVIEDTERYGSPNYKHIYRTSNIENVDRIYEELKKIPSRYNIFRTHSQLKTSEAINEENNFKTQKKNAIMVVCDKLETGYNDPPITMVTIGTGSDEHPSHRVIQLWGRCLRKYGKKDNGTLVFYLSQGVENGLKYIASKIYQQIALMITNNDSGDEIDKVKTRVSGNGIEVIINMKKVMISVLDIQYDGLTIEREVKKLILTDSIKKKGMQFQTLKNLIQLHNVKTYEEYLQLHERFLHLHIPKNPDKKYKITWQGWGEFLGYDISQYYSYDKCCQSIYHIMESIDFDWKNEHIDTVYNKLHECDNKIPPRNILFHFYKEDILSVINSIIHNC